MSYHLAQNPSESWSSKVRPSFLKTQVYVLFCYCLVFVIGKIVIFLECYWFPLLFTEALCTSKGCLQKSSVARLVPGPEGSLHSSYPPGATVQEFSILHQSHAPGRGGAGERRVGPLLCLPKVSQALRVGACPAEIPFPGLHWAAGWWRQGVTWRTKSWSVMTTWRGVKRFLLTT